MALIMPFLVVLLFGSVDLGYYFYNQHQVVKGVRDGARFASRQAFTSIGCNGTTAVAIPGDVGTAIREITRTGQISNGTPRVPGWENADITLSVDCSANAVSQTGIYVNEDNAPRITVATTVNHNSLFAGLVLDSTLSLNARQETAGMGI
jgi:Flp pilus assembly protein TadG